MSTTAVRTLKPNVTEEEAIRVFSAPGFSALYWRMRLGPLQKIAEAYVPFWFYGVRYELGRTPHTRLFALDAVAGLLDLFEFPRIPEQRQLVSVDSRNRMVPSLAGERAEEILREKVLRIVFQQGFFKLREDRREIAREPGEMYLPYWLGFYGTNGLVHCRVMDAVRRRIEGAKASAFFEKWLTA
ncbi:MAG: hypothetical protein DMG49_04700 [Acidobacteria bacterium]|nr:MAG: hypothetical protein DMG49_04700 [Acidobacteriota bacterium]